MVAHKKFIIGLLIVHEKFISFRDVFKYFKKLARSSLEVFKKFLKMKKKFRKVPEKFIK